MSRIALGLMIAVLGLSLVPGSALATEDVQGQLKTMQQQIQQLQQSLQATSDQLHQANQRISSQQDLIQRSAISRQDSSGLSSFLNTVEVNGWLDGSWLYRFPSADNGSLAGANAGSGGYTDPFHPDANSFSLDQLWLSMSRPTSAENRAGFQFDVVMGKTAQLLNFIGTGSGDPAGSFLQFYLQQAYIEYLAPIGPNGIKIQAGKMETWIGSEVVEAPNNFNITRGLVWDLFQPITNAGIRADMDLGHGFDAGLGFVNGTRAGTSTDLTNDKALVAKLAYNADTWGIQLAGTYGDASDAAGTVVPARHKETIIDLILSWNPSDKFSSYINADWLSSQQGSGQRGVGIAAAGRYAITDRAGIALRAEWIDLTQVGAPTLRTYTLTGTVDYKLTDHLTVKAETRFDNAHMMNVTGFSDPYFNGSGAATRDSQVTTGVEVLYTF